MKGAAALGSKLMCVFLSVEAWKPVLVVTKNKIMDYK